MSTLSNITAGKPRALLKPVFYTTIANLASIVPFVLLVEAARLIFEPFVHPDAPLNTGRLWWICAWLIASLVLLFLTEMPAYRAQFGGAYSVAAEGRARLAEHLRKLSLGYLNKRDPGDLANMMMGDFAMVEHGISHLVPQMIGALIMPVIAIVGLSFIDWRMALALFAAFPVAIMLVLLTSGIQRKLGAQHMRAKIDAANRLQEYLNGIRVIKAYNLTGERFVRLEKSFREFMRQSIRIEGLLGPIVLAAIACIRAGLTLMVIAGTYLLAGGNLDLITFVMFLLVGTRIFDPLTTALVNYAEFRYHEQAGERIVDLLAEPTMPGELHPPDENDVTLDHVSFGYNEKLALDNVSMHMPTGSFTALVGPSGSGKSTVLRLIARFYDPTSGQVLLGQQPLAKMDPEALLSRISMVFQDVYLFQDTIANNIRFGKRDATQKEIETAARQACCHEFIMQLPNGYETMVGEGGSTLSGGEKQRISIARAMLKNAPIVLLDEATASLDPENEAHIQQAIDRLIQGRTVIAIAHRLKTIRHADQIYVLDQGRVVEAGKHDELIARHGLYAKLWGLQQQTSGWHISS
ncbi:MULTISPECIES: ABC transporter ATP-binding protein [Brevibacillus]|jgi:ABC-type multidrug transport system, ATPase and permease components|uniref:ABC transporter ATP-binding protein n=1 Tax=Brevibacillus parabrevis TaxID=54914 RepID=A0A4Y3PC96_BREPA|nr:MULTISPECIES: ABC transporter ATP-binding protein [Brevibacillus]MDH6349839.1 ATP-binding cassette subfamily B protein IrtB [Brevibacillus sp. 1238]MDR4999292.1 ABC transporter ATP-binding protein [Brevibacillus parabrevis]NRQ56692.1 ABC transporter ATP-binding protein [Brevibacillus sp. HD1.4A]RNB94175.1 ABC transporter ATP-binding protein [Brevibacillus parabrevis]GEB31067.1 ABC transporter ATP-binding protein [Brevibacillus parabrevis]